MAALTQEDRGHIQTIVEETWVKASLSSDWDTVTALCTEDIDYMPADIPWVHGRNELTGFLEGFPRRTGNGCSRRSACNWGAPPAPPA